MSAGNLTLTTHSSLASPSICAKAKAARRNWFGRLADKVLTEIEVRRAMHEISAFDDAMLRDIGLDRGGLEHPLRHGGAPPDDGCGLRR